VGVDITTAVDAARENLTDRANIHLVQASVYELPFKAASFDLCYCIGVIQHTPDPEQTVRSLPRVLTAGGILALTAYERRRWTKLNGKYLARRLLRRVRPETLMKALVYTMPALFPLTELLFRIPVIGRFAAFAIPVANYVRVPQLSLRQRYRWSIMDTFDMLAPAYDVPQRYQDISRVLRAAGMVDIRRLPARGLCVLSRKESR